MEMHFGMIELALVFGATLAIGFWELFSIRQEIRRGREKAKRGLPHSNAHDD